MITGLTSPSSLTANAANKFTAQAGTTLNANTTYHVVVISAGGGSLSTTASNDEDSGGATGWSIANDGHFRNQDGSGNWQSFNQARRISVNAPELSHTALSALTAEGSTDGSTFAALTGANALAPAFAADTTGYRATVGNDVTHVKLTPTVAVDGSTVKVGPTGGTLNTVTSGSASAAIELAVGDNAITVEVTAADGATRDYTVTVTRVPSGTEWHATLVPETATSGDPGVGCGGGNCGGPLTDNDFTVGGENNAVHQLTDFDSNTFVVQFSEDSNAALQALKFCVGPTEFSIGAGIAIRAENTDVGWTAGVPVSLSIGTACAQQTTSSNADLSALTAVGSTDGTTFTALTGANALAPAFDAATTGYRATVGNDITHVKAP